MSNPRYAHPYQPTRTGRCGRYVGGNICHLPEDAPVHRRAQTDDEPDTLQTVYEAALRAASDDQLTTMLQVAAGTFIQLKREAMRRGIWDSLAQRGLGMKSSELSSDEQ